MVCAGIDIDVDDADIGAERKSEIRRIVIVDRLQPGLHAGRHFVIGRPGELGHGLEALRIALDPEAIDVPFQIVVVHFEHVGGDHLRLGLDLAAGHGGRGARHRRRARAVGAEPIGRGVGVALLDHDVVGGQAKLGGDDLGIGRLVTLALRLGAEPADAAAGRMNADFRGIEHGDAENVAGARRAGADDLGEEGDADAHQLAGLAALEGFALCLLLVAQLLVVDRLHRLVHGGLIVAGIVLPAERATCRGIARAGSGSSCEIRPDPCRAFAP